jgi:hypothetical protein
MSEYSDIETKISLCNFHPRVFVAVQSSTIVTTRLIWVGQAARQDSRNFDGNPLAVLCIDQVVKLEQNTVFESNISSAVHTHQAYIDLLHIELDKGHVGEILGFHLLRYSIVFVNKVVRKGLAKAGESQQEGRLDFTRNATNVKLPVTKISGAFRKWTKQAMSIHI